VHVRAGDRGMGSIMGRYNRADKTDGSSIHAGGGSGIRTHDTVSRIHAFQACALSHSAIPPKRSGARNIVAGDEAATRSPTPVHRSLRRSVDQPHLAGLAHVVAGELRRPFAKRGRAEELEQRLRALQEIVALPQRQVEALPDQRHEG
jgi:hypothetical protein